MYTIKRHLRRRPKYKRVLENGNKLTLHEEEYFEDVTGESDTWVLLGGQQKQDNNELGRVGIKWFECVGITWVTILLLFVSFAIEGT